MISSATTSAFQAGALVLPLRMHARRLQCVPYRHLGPGAGSCERLGVGDDDAVQLDGLALLFGEGGVVGIAGGEVGAVADGAWGVVDAATVATLTATATATVTATATASASAPPALPALLPTPAPQHP